MLIYQAGAISEYERRNEFNKAKEWRTKATMELLKQNIKSFNPTIRYATNKTFDVSGVPLQNLTYLKSSDLILLNLEYLDKSPGTISELAWAYLLHKPVVAFGINELYLNSPHITEFVTVHFKDLEHALEYVKSMYLQTI
jgi:nucleoside 2-deoxyribosyltransferase